jgi:hypothetical protein
MGVRVDIKGRWPFSTCKPKDSDLSSSGDPNLPTSHYIFVHSRHLPITESATHPTPIPNKPGTHDKAE